MITWILLAAFVLALALTFGTWTIIHARMRRTNDRNFILTLWEDLKTQENSQLKLVEADRIVDSALTKFGWSGSFEQKIDAGKDILRSAAALKAAHATCEAILQNPNMQPDGTAIDGAVAAYEQALRDLNVLR